MPSPTFQRLSRSQGRVALTLGLVERVGLPSLCPPLGLSCRAVPWPSPLCHPPTRHTGLSLLLSAPNITAEALAVALSASACLPSGSVCLGDRATVFSLDILFQESSSLEGSTTAFWSQLPHFYTRVIYDGHENLVLVCLFGFFFFPWRLPWSQGHFVFHSHGNSLFCPELTEGPDGSLIKRAPLSAELVKGLGGRLDLLALTPLPPEFLLLLGTSSKCGYSMALVSLECLPPDSSQL